MSKTKQEIYRIIDSFLAEAKDQNGKERSLEQLNRDRHLAAERFEKLINQQKQEIKRDLQSVIYMLEGLTDRQKIANYVREYLLKE